MPHLLDCDLLPGGAVAHLDHVAARAVPEVAEHLEVVDGRLHAHAVQLQQAVLGERKKERGNNGQFRWGFPDRIENTCVVHSNCLHVT